MIYEFKNNILYIYKEGELNIIQPYNPITEKAFKAEANAVDWLIHYIQTTYNAMPIQSTMTVTPISLKSMEELNEERLIVIDEPFNVNFHLDAPCLNSKVDLYVFKLNEGTMDFYKKYELDSLNNNISKNLIFDEPGKYMIWLEGFIDSDSGKKILIHKKDDFVIDVV